MGSSGTGRFDHYPPSGGGITPAGGGTDPCAGEVVCALEEVARCQYYQHHQGTPPAGTLVVLSSGLVGGRQAVETVVGAEVVGYLPTAFNYLRQCVARGHQYSGTVESSGMVNSVPVVRVRLTP